MVKKLQAIPRCKVSRKPRLAVIAVLAGTVVATESAMAAVLKVYWTDRDNATLSVTDLIGGGTNVLAQNFARLQDVDLDTSTGILYFADWGPGFPGGQGSINRVNKDGTGLATVLNTNDAVHQLALDQAIQRIYFTRAVSYDNREISHVDTSGANYTVLHSGAGAFTNGWFYSGLALDKANNLLYWGDIGILTPAPPADGSVNRMTTTGGAITGLTPHVNGRGRGYALDQASQTIFLTAHDPISPGTGGGLFSYDIANDIETLLISDPTTGYWDIEIDPVDQRIWWTDYGRGQIRSAMFDGSDVQVELSNLTNPYGLALEITGDDCSGFPCGNNGNKVQLCHVPPGNPANPQTLCISPNAVPAHLANHPEDHCGPCEDDDDSSADGAVDVLDLIDLLLCFGRPSGLGCESNDRNGDGMVNVLDLIDLLLVFGTASP